MLSGRSVALRILEKRKDVNDKILTPAIKACIDKCILCWLATSSNAQPNVSPKELFTHQDDEYIIIANIASPQSVKNIKSNPQVCVSMIDILVQKGYQLKGQAEILTSNDERFERYAEPLFHMTCGKFPFREIIAIKLYSVKPIIAPSYIFFPEETTVKGQIAQAKKAYGI